MNDIILKVVDIFSSWDIDTLYKLLLERTPGQAISHKKMPTHGEHKRFVKSRPYKAWYIIMGDEDAVGATYITHANEIGIFIFNRHKGKGYAITAVKELMSRYEGPFYANINPTNLASKAFFAELGFKLLQETYVFGDE